MKTNCECPSCGDVFASRKARHMHQMAAHRNERTEGTQRTKDKNRRRDLKKMRQPIAVAA